MIAALLFFYLPLAYSQECFDINEVDFTFYCRSGSDDWIVSSDYPNGLWATVISNPNLVWAVIPESDFIWKNPTYGACNITVTKSFFLIASATSVNLYLVCDDYATATINDLNSCKATYGSVSICDMTSAIKTGLNELKIEAQNTGGNGGLSYKLEVNIRL
ncbi:hypothetical protein SteCoe_23018 [Stentor coeruleus]|uniref:Cyanovirin-N domain-containing protein n=1 Tax=Stentor coeruleus TaxID=5963 RepID=A0A1R2BL10_9CILI|nr:hypothetical protein SteCoe_23018 [Stentor coeruleus]